MFADTGVSSLPKVCQSHARASHYPGACLDPHVMFYVASSDSCDTSLHMFCYFGTIIGANNNF